MNFDKEDYRKETAVKGCLGCVGYTDSTLCMLFGDNCAFDNIVWVKKEADTEVEFAGITYVSMPETDNCAGCDARPEMCDQEWNDCDVRSVIWKEKESMQEAKSALDKQVGSNHYKLSDIQPIEYIHANNLSFCEGNVVKYITRHRNKNKEEDVRKALHYCQLILKLEYGLDE